MIFVISPAKSLDFNKAINTEIHSKPIFSSEIKTIIKELKKLSVNDISKLMNISPKLAEINFERYKNFSNNFNLQNSKQAIAVFDGDVYSSIDASKYSKDEFNYAQENVRIISGLYGILKPLDLIQAYRLEMSTKLSFEKYLNLYNFWGDKISKSLKSELSSMKNKVIINLASDEYFKAVKDHGSELKIINITFKEKKSDGYKIIGIFAKKARGLFIHYAIKNKISEIDDLKKFNLGGYSYIKEISSPSNIIFHRN